MGLQQLPDGLSVGYVRDLLCVRWLLALCRVKLVQQQHQLQQHRHHHQPLSCI
jgi:hypothetical protein